MFSTIKHLVNKHNGKKRKAKLKALEESLPSYSLRLQIIALLDALEKDLHLISASKAIESGVFFTSPTINLYGLSLWLDSVNQQLTVNKIFDRDHLAATFYQDAVATHADIFINTREDHYHDPKEIVKDFITQARNFCKLMANTDTAIDGEEGYNRRVGQAPLKLVRDISLEVLRLANS